VLLGLLEVLDGLVEVAFSDLLHAFGHLILGLADIVGIATAGCCGDPEQLAKTEIQLLAAGGAFRLLADNRLRSGHEIVEDEPSAAWRIYATAEGEIIATPEG
jgi:hypothetical protein